MSKYLITLEVESKWALEKLTKPNYPLSLWVGMEGKWKAIHTEEIESE